MIARNSPVHAVQPGTGEIRNGTVPLWISTGLQKTRFLLIDLPKFGKSQAWVDLFQNPKVDVVQTGNEKVLQR